MSIGITDKITKATGAEQVSKEFVYNDIKRVCFDADTDYTSIVEATAEINDEIADRVVVWGCGVSEDGYPRVAIQRFESIDPDDIDGIDTFDSNSSSSGGAAVKRSFSTQTDGN